jgi:thiamine monophosphate kinase
MILILAGTYAQAVDYCVQERLHRSSVIIVTQEEQLRGRQIRPGDDVRVVGGSGRAWARLMDMYHHLARIGATR